MEIRWDKWVVERLPMKLRTHRMQALCMVFCSPVERLYVDFTKWRKRMRIKAGGSPQVCMLKKTVYDELGIVIEIAEGDGKPVDFIIRTAFTDTDKERQLFALLDRYKLAGKSYAYENKEIAFECVWSGYVCEDNPLACGWVNYICEINKPYTVNAITITYYWKYDAAWNATIIKRLVIQAEHPVESNIDIVSEMYVIGQPSLTIKIPLEVGQSYVAMDTWVMDKHENERVSPPFDKYYEYKIKAIDVYE